MALAQLACFYDALWQQTLRLGADRFVLQLPTINFTQCSFESKTVFPGFLVIYGVYVATVIGVRFYLDRGKRRQVEDTGGIFKDANIFGWLEAIRLCASASAI